MDDTVTSANYMNSLEYFAYVPFGMNLDVSPPDTRELPA